MTFPLRVPGRICTSVLEPLAKECCTEHPSRSCSAVSVYVLEMGNRPDALVGLPSDPPAGLLADALAGGRPCRPAGGRWALSGRSPCVRSSVLNSLLHPPPFLPVMRWLSVLNDDPKECPVPARLL